MRTGVRGLGVLSAAIVFAALVQPVRAQEAPWGRQDRDPLLERLVGGWRMTGHVRGEAVGYHLSVRHVLDDRFLELHMRDTAALPRYEARIFIGRDTISGRIIVHWLDTFGAAYSVPPGYGSITGDTLRFEVAYPDGPFRDTFVFRRTEGVWELHIEAGNGQGAWRTFARYTVHPISPVFR